MGALRQQTPRVLRDRAAAGLGRPAGESTVERVWARLRPDAPATFDVAARGGFALPLAACEEAGPAPPGSPAGGPDAAAPAVASAPGRLSVPLPPPAPPLDPNPLQLPPRKVKLDAGRRVFTFSERMLSGAKLGSTLIFYAATVSGFDGDDLIIEGRAGPSYKVHGGYVIPVPDDPRVRVGEPVLTEWNGTMKHAVVVKLLKDRTVVRYTDMDPKTPEGQLKQARFVRQTDGLVPGNYAAMKDGEEWRHVLLVSPLGGESELRRWFALGFGGAALIADEAALRPIPVKWSPKVGAPVLAEWVGALRKATVQATGDTGLFTVKFERAGRPATVGWGLLMKPIE
jgi:hypothetical protein